MANPTLVLSSSTLLSDFYLSELQHLCLIEELGMEESHTQLIGLLQQQRRWQPLALSELNGKQTLSANNISCLVLSSKAPFSHEFHHIKQQVVVLGVQY
ncbi:hypothetical protein FRC07_004011 [Ceratobasidium sp. 392]|nr:hypothetical protein FRC07_004011 [Ceratobasidium sp. 392]